MADTRDKQRPDEKPRPPEAAEPPRRHISMHEDVPVWHDCCCCEAEPYWVEAMAEAEETETEDREAPPGEHKPDRR